MLTSGQIRKAASVPVRSILLALHCDCDTTYCVLVFATPDHIQRQVRVPATYVHQLVFGCGRGGKLAWVSGCFLYLIDSPNRASFSSKRLQSEFFGIDPVLRVDFSLNANETEGCHVQVMAATIDGYRRTKRMRHLRDGRLVADCSKFR